MTIVIEGLVEGPLRRLIGKKLDALAGHLPRPPLTVHVGFKDENGPKGGVDIRCALTVEIPRRGALYAADLAATPREAFDLAFVALERRVLRDIDRARDRRRRPRKYLVARRLLESDPTREDVPAPGRRRRSA